MARPCAQHRPGRDKKPRHARAISHAAHLLVEVSPEAARKEVSKLLPQLGSGSNVNKSVLLALGALAREAREAGPQVAPLVTNGDPWVSLIAKHVVNTIGPDAVLVAPAGK